MHNILFKTTFIFSVLFSFNTLASEPTEAQIIEKLEAQNYTNIKDINCVYTRETTEHQKGKAVKSSLSSFAILLGEEVDFMCFDKEMKPYTGTIFDTAGWKSYTIWSLKDGYVSKGTKSFYALKGAKEIYTEKGKIIEEKFYDEGILLSSKSIKSDNPDILIYKQYYPNGKIKLDGEYKNDDQARKQPIITKSYYENGQLKEIRTYTDASNSKAIKECTEDGNCKEDVILSAFKQINSIATNINVLFSTQNNYIGLNNQLALKTGIVPSYMSSNDTIIHSLEGTVDIESIDLNGKDDAFVITFNNISNDNCNLLQQQDWSELEDGFITLQIRKNDDKVSCRECNFNDCSLTWLFSKIR